MITIRKNVFETNSSSCHSVTICKKSFYDKLMNYELFYTGDYVMSSDDSTYINELDESQVISLDEIKAMMKEGATADLKNSILTDYRRKIAQEVLDKLDKLTPEFVKEKPADWYDEDWEDKMDLYCDFTLPNRLFGSESGDDYCEDSMEYDLADGNKLLIKVVNIYC